MDSSYCLQLFYYYLQLINNRRIYITLRARLQAYTRAKQYRFNKAVLNYLWCNLLLSYNYLLNCLQDIYLLNQILVFKQLLYYKLYPISSVEKLKVCNYPLVKRLVYRGAIQRKELDARILKDYLNSCFIGAKAIKLRGAPSYQISFY